MTLQLAQDFPQLQPSLPLFSSSSSPSFFLSTPPLLFSLPLPKYHLSLTVFYFLGFIGGTPLIARIRCRKLRKKKICLTHVIDAFCSTAFLLPDFSTPTESFQPPNIISINQHLHLRNLRLQLGFQLSSPRSSDLSPPSSFSSPPPEGYAVPLGFRLGVD